ncbi:MAG TPA: hypothetical protein PK880_00435 [Candidatus Competibacter sp.]|nr:hypothetical protein [Candidatus Competibacter sp.]
MASPPHRVKQNRMEVCILLDFPQHELARLSGCRTVPLFAAQSPGPRHFTAPALSRALPGFQTNVAFNRF